MCAQSAGRYARPVCAGRRTCSDEWRRPGGGVGISSCIVAALLQIHTHNNINTQFYLPTVPRTLQYYYITFEL